MTLAEWVASQPPGARMRLMRASGVAYTTILRAVAGKPVKAAIARRIAEATRGNVAAETIAMGNPEAPPCS